ncbi:MAG: DUF839 domain-containing protein [Gammaproteobacteria bacterium]|nr:DUF839 domain-containing protein [Gammaproteobacteria bacterium]
MQQKWITLLIAAGVTQLVHAQSPLAVRHIDFTSTPVPDTRAEQVSVYTRSEVILSLANGKKVRYPLRYHPLYKTGEQVGHWKAGTIVDKTGVALIHLRNSKGELLSTGPFYAHSPDANSLLVNGTQLNLITHFEYDTEAPAARSPDREINLYGKLPMVMNRAVLIQQQDGELKATALSNIDMSAVAGIWNPCAGERTAWNTHLGGEEYEPDARTYAHQPLITMNRYLQTMGLTAQKGGANPYRYGYIVEVRVDGQDKTRVVKHYAMGRQSNELAHVMPDGRTAYKGDDGHDQVLTMFVADHTRDLSAGTLYAAQVEQHDAYHGGSFAIHWIRLGHASDEQIAAIVNRGIRFADIFDVASPATVAANPDAHRDYRPVYVYTGSQGTDSDRLTYLKLKPGMAQAAAFLETRRYAAYLGATTEFTKMEGVTSNNADRQLYIAMSYVEGGMLAGHNADRPRDDIHLSDAPEILKCGIVYQAKLESAQQDSEGHPINSDWVASGMQALVMGANKPAKQAYARFDRCDSDRVANPDNIKYSDALQTLFIGEDSDYHLNNFLWAYNVETHKLTRIASGIIGQEWTGLAAIDNLNGHTYLLSNVQHPGAAHELAPYRARLRAAGIDVDTLRSSIDQRGVVGYFGGFPAITLVPK